MDVSRKRLQWDCRRGMRELDVVLEAFLEHGYDHASPATQQCFRHLLAAPDADLYQWFTGQAQPDPQIRALIDDMFGVYRATLAVR